jgi:cyclophilin family peptidyl-prolyl cis-trans isomerase
MKLFNMLSLGLLLQLLLLPGIANAQEIKAAKPVVILQTTLGDISIELNPEKAPVTVSNFLSYVDSGFYDGTVFHRVIPNFMVQGGGFDPQLQQKATAPPIVNEAKNGLHNERGTIAMARTNNPDSATSQFFINLRMNSSLDWSERNPGYAVFGKVIAGMDTVDAMVLQPTDSVGMHQDVPVEPIIIEKAYLKTP